ncbi:p-hydroxycinnamoyl-CoA synthetase [Rhodococcus sp. 06-412-2C]|uniref:acyl-CoA synthetase n=1 Tax=unclassified Rhodococcus (in: high G+C Gram-positive bacteria) TaxID=192944 RepID=UPI000B9C57AF|nr:MULTISPECIES: long-chain fatty acid--CoA ligase [unclassified Rhodococcus (in: high G+C Gram-positive bacteria)]OZC83936.1 p-hydroxycinnamoyl-CoA synthetase [Rhodococcus sp. 06-412-2C]OZC94124.1 p-hydroxycinnamoyl-CoA synthetase [Rhodococcus sp. 06-412-2B]
MLNEGAGAWVHRRSRQTPNAVAIKFRGESRTYRELDVRVTRLANALRDLGISKGDRIAVLSDNHPAYLETLYAAGLLGAIFVPLNSRLTAVEIAYALTDSGAQVFVHSAALTATSSDAAHAVPTVEHRIAIDGAADACSHHYDTLIAEASADFFDLQVGHSDPALIMYTSGTTGRPKGVVLSHGNLLFAVMNAILDLDLLSDEVSLVTAPLFHTGALNMIALPTLLKGGTVVIDEGFEPGRTLRMIEEERITFSFGVPTMLDAMSSHPAWISTDLSSLRRLIAAAAPVPPRTLRTYTERNIRLCQGYGLTETGPGALILIPSDVERKLGTAGVPHFFTDVRVVDAVGRGVEPGQRGEIQISGPNVMTRYWNKLEETEATFTADGWLRSGDVGIPDSDGFVTIVDRLKDMIISGGENIYPAEIESVIFDIPGVTGAAVFGVSDAHWGEVGCAAVTLNDGVELSHERFVESLTPRLAKFKIPKLLVVVDEIPRNATGKIRKDILRTRFGSAISMQDG